ncbi:MAG: hypothetical protein KGN79_15255 [Acidobacteriota bacterium]|nr:hypothetical protein [Acidobacteriota bacterium]
MNLVLGIVQVLTLVALVVTVYVSYRQAKAAERATILSLKQVELMRTQLNSTFRPVVEVTGGEYGVNSASLTLQNVGNSPALMLTAICRSGYRERLGTLGPDKQRKFKFEGSFNLPQQAIGPPEYQDKLKLEAQPVPLRLEYTSVSGARCWTNINFPLGRQGVVDAEIEHGMDFPLLNTTS